jgi:hypothetical protein
VRSDVDTWDSLLSLKRRLLRAGNKFPARYTGKVIKELGI